VEVQAIDETVYKILGKNCSEEFWNKANVAVNDCGTRQMLR
jgi:hypothetical protein